uniref:EamA domain-containing protein n=1 Tax=Megaselia scalaris TaxID=36166 RepID=T1H0U6_MEGSC
MLSFYAFRHMPLGDASVIIFSTPVFVAIFARLFLKEQCGLINIITIMLTLIGVVLITRPSIIFTQPEDEFSNDFLSPSQSTSNRIWGSVAAVASTLFGANVYILLRALKDIHFAVIMSNFGMFALLY